MKRLYIFVIFGLIMAAGMPAMAQTKVLKIVSNGQVVYNSPTSEIDYVTMVEGTAPSTPLPPSDTNGREYVDLGLPSGLKWAAANLGASTPAELGSYYAWGEIEPKAGYYYNNSQYSLMSFSNLRAKNIVNAHGNLTADNDAASQAWGGTWRLPTKEDFEELISQCQWSWTNQDGQNGYMLTGPNGNSMFLPAAGAYDGATPSLAGISGIYWSATVDGSQPELAFYALSFDPSASNFSLSPSYLGRTIRPVTH